MRSLRVAVSRLAGLFSAERHEQLFDEELESHLQLHVDDNVRAGMTPDEARRQAILKLGGIESTRHAYRERSSLPSIEYLMQDLRFAFRQLAKSPGFTVTAILMLALGMGASVAIFALVDAALFRPLPYPEPARLVNVTERTRLFPRANLSYPDYLDWKRLNTVFQSLDIHNGRRFVLSTAAGTELVPGARVSDGFFRTLGVAPILGRDFVAGEDLPGTPATVMLSHGSWLARFGGRRDVIGQTVTLDTVPHTIVGVLPATFQFAPRGRVEFWRPFQASSECDLRRSCHGLTGVARLKDGVTVDTAQAEMSAIATQLEKQYPDSNRGQGAIVEPLAEVIVGNVRPLLLALLGGAGLLLVIACVNVSSLLLVRSESRKRELAIRSTLGASHGRLIRQFVTEALVLVLAGSALGVFCALGAVGLLVRLVPEDMAGRMPYLNGLGLNLHVLLFAGVVALVATAIFSLAPALRVSFSEVREGLAEGSRGSSGNTWHRLGFRLVVVELATAMVLLVCAGLLGKSLYRLLNVDLGFQPDRLATLQVAAPQAKYATVEQGAALGREVVRGIGQLPGVQSAAITSVLPVSFNGNTDWIRFVGRPYAGEHNEVNQRDVSPGYFATVRTTLVRGRYFTHADALQKPRVAIINQALANLYFPREDPIGKRFGDTSLSPASIKEIVGIVEDLREGPLDEEIWPAVYYPFDQSPNVYFALVVRTAYDEQAVLPTLRTALRDIDPDIGPTGDMTMRDRISESPVAYLKRSSASLVGGFAALALLLGVVGLYGVVAYSVSQRTREIGLRLAMGAQRRAVYQLILGEAARLAVVGIVAGVVCAMGAAMLMKSLLFGTPPWDVPTLVAVALALATAALLASYLPARRAASVNPIDALRVE